MKKIFKYKRKCVCVHTPCACACICSQAETVIVSKKNCAFWYYSQTFRMKANMGKENYMME